jgi:hypothetical protein
MLLSGVRFTHVVDNSIIHRRIKEWIDTDSPIRLHGADILFYVQSARESAHLLMDAGLNAEKGTFKLEAIRDLDWPVDLVDLAVGALAKNCSRTPIYIYGFQAGYEEMPYPGLYDIVTSGDVGPLISSFEASDANESPSSPQVDVFPLVLDMTPDLVRTLNELEFICATTDNNDDMKQGLENLSRAMLDARLGHVSLQSLRRLVKLLERNPEYGRLPAIHISTNEAVKAEIEKRTA